MSAAPKVNQSHPFMNRDVFMSLTNEMSHVLKSMANIDVDFQKPFVSTEWKSPKEISVILNLDDPSYKGRVCFHFDKDVAKKIIENMIGAPVEEGSPDILDGVGEVSNMFYGSTKTKLNTLGFSLNVSLPKPLWTKDLPPNISNCLSMIVPLKIENKDCFVEISIF